MSAPATQTRRDPRRLLAHLRRRQLELALAGRTRDSAKYACRAEKVRASLAPAGSGLCLACG